MSALDVWVQTKAISFPLAGRKNASITISIKQLVVKNEQGEKEIIPRSEIDNLIFTDGGFNGEIQSAGSNGSLRNTMSDGKNNTLTFNWKEKPHSYTIFVDKKMQRDFLYTYVEHCLRDYQMEAAVFCQGHKVVGTGADVKSVAWLQKRNLYLFIGAIILVWILRSVFS